MNVPIQPPSALPLRRKLWFDLDLRHGLYLVSAALVGVMLLFVHLSFWHFAFALIACVVAVSLALPLPGGLHVDEWLLQLAQYALQRAVSHFFAPLDGQDEPDHPTTPSAALDEVPFWRREPLGEETGQEGSSHDGWEDVSEAGTFTQSQAETGWGDDWATPATGAASSARVVLRPASRLIRAPANHKGAGLPGLVWNEALNGFLDAGSAHFLLDQPLSFVTPASDTPSEPAEEEVTPAAGGARILRWPLDRNQRREAFG